MRQIITTAVLSAVFLAACKTTSPDAAKLRTEGDGTQSSKPAFSTERVCELLRAEEFPSSSVSVQIQWLCDRGGFSQLDARSYSGKGEAAAIEYFNEHDKTLYYAAGMAVGGSLDGLAGINDLFCDDFETLRGKFSGNGLEDVQALQVSQRGDGRCEYFQQAKPTWGVRADVKAVAQYGKFTDINVEWRVDSMIAPLNYSPVKQFSVLSLSWEDAGQLRSAYILRTQVQVSGLVMGSVRSKMKATVGNVMKGYINFLK